MSYTIKAAEDGDYILIEVHGLIDRENGFRMTLESHILGRQLGIDRYLMDLTDAVNQESALHQYNYAYADLRNSEDLNRFAICAGLVRPSDHSHDFIETVVRNAGFNFKLFRDLQQALAYIGQPATLKEKQL